MAKNFRNKTFTKVLRGYSSDEVDEYIAYINEEYQKLAQKNSDSERKLALALKKLDESQRNADNSAEKAELDSAVKNANEILREAEERRTEILNEAAAEAEKITQNAAEAAKKILESAEEESEKALSDAKTEADGVYGAASDMYDEVCSFRDSLFSLYNTHIEAIESIAESAKSYIDKTDKTYSDATGEAVSHDNDDEEAEEDEEADHVEENITDDIVEDNVVDTEDVEELPDSVRDVYIDLLEDEDEEFSYEDDDDADEEDLLQIDWKNHRAVGADEASDDETRVLDLRTMREAASDMQFADDYDDSGDFEAPQDFEEDVESQFREMDSLFTEDKSGHKFSLTDEFDIVFANSDSRKNVEEIRRQPTVVPEEPKKSKKHRKF